MQMDALEILDTTLRDGAQGEGLSFSIEDKLSIVQALDHLGIRLIEAGNPGASQKDEHFFKQARQLPLRNARLVAFGSTRRKQTAPEEDPALRALAGANTQVVSVFGKSWDFQVLQVLETTLEENLAMISETVAYLRGLGREVIFDAEHFFDGYKANREYALMSIDAAAAAGASRIALCDTNGGCFPDEISDIVREISGSRSCVLGIHCHNDAGMAVAGTVMAVAAGARHVQGTLLGFGERCGNANLASVIAGLQIKRNYRCIPPECMKLLTGTARYVAEISNAFLSGNAPYVGVSAFAHKAGMHASGVIKTPLSFEHIPPESVGNERRLLTSEMAGRAAMWAKIQKFVPELHRDAPEVQRLMDKIKQLEMKGYQFEGAECSFEILIRKELMDLQPFFELLRFWSLSEAPKPDSYSSSVFIKVQVGQKSAMTAAEGDGPVNALDTALRGALGEFYPCLKEVHLIDYKVRVLDPESATAAKVRVLISSTDGKSIWTTVGVSTDIIQASLLALMDSIDYKLIHNAQR